MDILEYRDMHTQEKRSQLITSSVTWKTWKRMGGGTIPFTRNSSKDDSYFFQPTLQHHIQKRISLGAKSVKKSSLIRLRCESLMESLIVVHIRSSTQFRAAFDVSKYYFIVHYFKRTVKFGIGVFVNSPAIGEWCRLHWYGHHTGWLLFCVVCVKNMKGI